MVLDAFRLFFLANWRVSDNPEASSPLLSLPNMTGHVWPVSRPPVSKPGGCTQVSSVFTKPSAVVYLFESPSSPKNSRAEKRVAAFGAGSFDGILDAVSAITQFWARPGTSLGEISTKPPPSTGKKWRAGSTSTSMTGKTRWYMSWLWISRVMTSWRTWWMSWWTVSWTTAEEVQI